MRPCRKLVLLEMHPSRRSAVALALSVWGYDVRSEMPADGSEVACTVSESKSGATVTIQSAASYMGAVSVESRCMWAVRDAVKQACSRKRGPKVSVKTILDTLGKCEGNKHQASRELGIPRQSIYQQVQRYEVRRAAESVSA